jgi:hypothetical protein
VSGGELRLGERQDDPTLDDGLGLLHAPKLVPQRRLDHPAPEPREGRRRRHRGRDLPLQAPQRVHLLESGPDEQGVAFVRLPQDREELPCSLFDQPCREPIQQAVSHLRPSALGSDGEPPDPAHRADGGACHHAHDPLIGLRDEGNLGPGGHQIDGLINGETVRPQRDVAGPFPQLQDPAQVLGPVSPNGGAHGGRTMTTDPGEGQGRSGQADTGAAGLEGALDTGRR